MHSSLNSMLKSSNPHPNYRWKDFLFSINLAEVESSTYQIQIRMAQLKTSIQLECWSIHLKYWMICRVFLLPVKSRFLLPFCWIISKWHLLFFPIVLISVSTVSLCLVTQMSGIVMKNGLWQETDSKLSHICNQILLSFLAIPIYSNEEESGNEEDERLVKIAQYLGLSSVPTRQAIQRDILLMKGNVIFKFAAPLLLNISIPLNSSNNNKTMILHFFLNSFLPIVVVRNYYRTLVRISIS